MATPTPFSAPTDRAGSSTNFIRHVPGCGEFRLRPLQLDEDVPLIHDWVSRDYARYWGMQDQSVADVRAAYEQIANAPHSSAFAGLYNGRLSFLMEKYHALDEPIANCYEARSGDYGMHILVAPPRHHIPGFTWHAFTTVMAFMFSDPRVERVVVEPDVRNDKIHALNNRAGFLYQRVIELPGKQAYLAFCTRAGFDTALRREQA
ncbi:MAG: GNAT family N-acetyltransferase [Aquisalimonadaceae bacterium]